MKKNIILLITVISCITLINITIKDDYSSTKKEHNKSVNLRSTDYLNVDFNKLLEVNKDIVGFIIIKDTDINYPILKSNNNEHYINHDFKGNINKTGSIFQDFNNETLKDKEITLYGNNLRKGMFADVRKIYNQELGNDVYIKIITKKEVLTFKVFDVLKNNISKEIDFEIDVTKNDQILNLKTIGGTFEYSLKAIKIGEE